MALFIFHTGDLTESLKTTYIVRNIQELRNLLIQYREAFLFSEPVEFCIEISCYPSPSDCFDARTGWYTQSVFMIETNIKVLGKSRIIGFLSEPLEI